MDAIDLFEDYDILPYSVRTILETADENKDTYKENDRMIKELAPLGYTFDYGLCGTPMDLKRIYNEKLMGLVEKYTYIKVVGTGLDGRCKRVISYGVLYRSGDNYIHRGNDGVDVIMDNLCDVFVLTPENLQKIKNQL